MYCKLKYVVIYLKLLTNFVIVRSFGNLINGNIIKATIDDAMFTRIAWENKRGNSAQLPRSPQVTPASPKITIQTSKPSSSQSWKKYLRRPLNRKLLNKCIIDLAKYYTLHVRTKFLLVFFICFSWYVSV